MFLSNIFIQIIIFLVFYKKSKDVVCNFQLPGSGNTVCFIKQQTEIFVIKIVRRGFVKEGFWKYLQNLQGLSEIPR